MPYNNKDNKHSLPAYEVPGVRSGNLNFDDFSDTLKLIYCDCVLRLQKNTT